jgi:DNA helicase II / ATP-dependent DNA helicase PcrA
MVRVLNVVDGCIPAEQSTETPEEIEEERRLLYVAMTRAKDELDLIVPERSYIRNQFKTDDRYIYGSRSRFIPAGVTDLLEYQKWHDRLAKRVAHKGGATTDVTASLRRLWR